MVLIAGNHGILISVDPMAKLELLLLAFWCSLGHELKLRTGGILLLCSQAGGPGCYSADERAKIYT